MIHPVIYVCITSVIDVCFLRLVKVTRASLDLQSNQPPGWSTIINSLNMSIDAHVFNQLFAENPVEFLNYYPLSRIYPGASDSAVARHLGYLASSSFRPVFVVRFCRRAGFG